MLQLFLYFLLDGIYLYTREQTMLKLLQISNISWKEKWCINTLFLALIVELSRMIDRTVIINWSLNWHYLFYYLRGGGGSIKADFFRNALLTLTQLDLSVSKQLHCRWWGFRALLKGTEVVAMSEGGAQLFHIHPTQIYPAGSEIFRPH